MKWMLFLDMGRVWLYNGQSVIDVAPSPELDECRPEHLTDDVEIGRFEEALNTSARTVSWRRRHCTIVAKGKKEVEYD